MIQFVLFFILFDQFIYLKLVFEMFITLCVGEDGSGRLVPPSGRIPDEQVSPKESPVLQKRRVYDILQYHIHLNTLKLLHYIVLKYTFKI